MEENRFVEMWNTSKERIFPDWSADIRELKSESASGEKFNVEVILDRMDGKEFFSLFDYEGENIADSLGGSGTVAVMSPQALIRRYEKQMKASQPLFRFYRLAASASDLLGMRHPEISSAPDSRFDHESRNGILEPEEGRMLFPKGTRESAETYFSLFYMVRKLWQYRTSGKKLPAGTDTDEDAAAFAVLMMDVLFQIDYSLDEAIEDELVRQRIRRRAAELAEELY